MDKYIINTSQPTPTPKPKNTTQILENPTYKLQSAEAVECFFCKAHSNLYAINKHMQTKKCLKLREAYLLLHPDKKNVMSSILRQTNDMKRRLCGNDNDDDDDE